MIAKQEQFNKMAIIDPDGLFFGERLAACSDLAQLYWPRFFLAANGYGRLELSYKSIISHVFANFSSPPKSEEIWQIFREYDDNFLAVLYETDGGVWWCQFITSEKFLPKYKKTRDKSSPAPPLNLLKLHHDGYIAWKRSKSFQNQSFQKSSEISQWRGVGIGVGVGVGEIQNLSPKKLRREPDQRHSLFKEILAEYWKYANHKSPEMPWGPADAKQLANLLAASPGLNQEEFRRLLRNRARSDLSHGEPVHKWISMITKFTDPLDQYGKPKTSGANNGSVPHGKTKSNMVVLAESLARGQRENSPDEDGLFSTSEPRQGDPGTVHGLLASPGPESVPSSDGESSRKRETGG